MNNSKSKVLIGVMLGIGLFGFISGQFIIATVLLASLAMYNHLALSKALSKNRKQVSIPLPGPPVFFYQNRPWVTERTQEHPNKPEEKAPALS
ncbi:MAG: hypothetical protein PHY16_11430 [Methylobacter sp.]|nr:hypothetical protein [Methylobacter sp.]